MQWIFHWPKSEHFSSVRVLWQRDMLCFHCSHITQISILKSSSFFLPNSSSRGVSIGLYFPWILKPIRLSVWIRRQEVWGNKQTAPCCCERPRQKLRQVVNTGWGWRSGWMMQVSRGCGCHIGTGLLSVMSCFHFTPGWLWPECGECLWHTDKLDEL